MKIKVILVPYDCGYYRRRTGLGPERILEAGLKPLFAKQGIQFESESTALESAYPTEISAAFGLARQITHRVRTARSRGEFPIVLSGNCNAAVGTVSGCGPERTGMVWFDAHGEAPTPETTASGFLDGMPISTLLGRAWQTLAKTVPGFEPIPGERVILVDGRAAEPSEIELLMEAGVTRVATSGEFAARLVSVAREVEQLYLHVDLDVLDPSAATANQWTPPGGLTIEDLVRGIVKVCQQAKVVALGIASYEPARDANGRALQAAAAVVETVVRSR